MPSDAIAIVCSVVPKLCIAGVVSVSVLSEEDHKT